MKISKALEVHEDTLFVEAYDSTLVVSEADSHSAHAHSHSLPVHDITVVEEEPALEFLPGTDMVMDLKGPENEEVEDKEVDTDWENDGDHGKFLEYIKQRASSIPRHDGKTILGCERAISFLKSLQSEIQQAIKSDLKGAIDVSAADKEYVNIEKMISKLEGHKDRLKKKASFEVRLFSETTCEKCENNAPMWHNVAENKLVCMACESEESQNDGLKKEAGTAKLQVYISAFESGFCRILINGAVSAGHNIEDMFMKLKNKYDLKPREELAIIQILEDMGYPMHLDRGRINEGADPQDEDGLDFSASYYA